MGLAPLPLSARQLNWLGDGYMERNEQMQRRPPIAVPRPPPSPRPVSAASSSRSHSRPGTARSALSPRGEANPIVGGRPLHTSRPVVRIGLSQQDVYNMMNDASLSQTVDRQKALVAREHAARRANKRQAAERREQEKKEEARKAAQVEALAQQEAKMRVMFGLAS